MTSRFSHFQKASDGSFVVVDKKTSITEFNRKRLSIIQSVCESIISEDESKLNFMTASMFSTTLEDTILRLNMLDQCNNELRVKMVTQHMDSLLAKRYDVKPPAQPEDFIKYPLNCDENKLDKMVNDRKLCTDVLKELYQELCKNKTFTYLQEFLMKKIEEEGHPFEKEVNERKLLYKQVKYQLRSERNVHTRGIYDSEEVIGKLKDLLSDTEHQYAIKSRYTLNWKNALNEQNELRIHEAQDQHMSSISRYKREQDRETRAHEEVERFNNIVISETVEKVEEIMKKYEEDVENFDLKIQLAMSRLTEISQKRRDMKKKLKSRQKEMDAWSKVIKERAVKNALIKRKNDAAIIVQAWWRGLLVRKQLGPFRPKKSKAGKKKGRTGRSKIAVNDEEGD